MKKVNFLVLSFFFISVSVLFSFNVELGFNFPIVSFSSENSSSWGPYSLNFSQIDYYTYGMVYYEETFKLDENNFFGGYLFLKIPFGKRLGLRIGGGVRKRKSDITVEFTSHGKNSGGIPDFSLSEHSETSFENEKSIIPIVDVSFYYKILRWKSLNLIISIGLKYEINKENPTLILYYPSDLPGIIDYWEIPSSIKLNNSFYPYISFINELYFTKRFGLFFEARILKTANEREITYNSETLKSKFYSYVLNTSEVDSSYFQIKEVKPYYFRANIGFNIKF